MFNVSALLLDDALLKCVVTEVVLFSIVAFEALIFHKVRVRIRITVRIRFGVWLVSCLCTRTVAYVYVRLQVVIVTDRIVARWSTFSASRVRSTLRRRAAEPTPLEFLPVAGAAQIMDDDELFRAEISRHHGPLTGRVHGRRRRSGQDYCNCLSWLARSHGPDRPANWTFNENRARSPPSVRGPPPACSMNSAAGQSRRQHVKSSRSASDSSSSPKCAALPCCYRSLRKRQHIHHVVSVRFEPERTGTPFRFFF